MYYPIYPEAVLGDEQFYLVTGLFEEAADVEDVLRALEKENYGQDDIALAMTDETRGKSFAIEKRSKAGESAAGFGALGGVGGAIITALLSTGAVASGGLNLVAAGPYLATLAGFGAGSLAGGFFGALIGMGIPEYELDFYKNALKNGNVLVAVKTAGPEHADIVKDIFEKNNAIMKDEEWEIDNLAKQSM